MLKNKRKQQLNIYKNIFIGKQDKTLDLLQCKQHGRKLSCQSRTECIVCNVIADLNEGCEFLLSYLSCTDRGAQIIVCVRPL